MLYKNFKRLIVDGYNFLVKSKKIWYSPKNSQILIYDAQGLEALLPYIKKYSFDVLHRNGEFINIVCLIRAILTWRFWTSGMFNIYSLVYIQAVNPKIIITFIDNSTSFYLLSKKFPNIKTIFLQNGTRGLYGDVFEYLEKSDKYYVDYMFVHNKQIGNLYSQYISGKIIASGSLKNNSVPRSGPVKKNILYISQWRKKPTNNEPLFTLVNGLSIHWNEFYEADIAVIHFLDSWCKKFGIQLTICGSQKGSEDVEEAFFKQYLKQCNWEFIPKTSIYSGYQQIDAADLVVSIDSTLGYEALSRGKKTAIFSCRMIAKAKLSLYKFGWPTTRTDSGPFWTNSIDEIEFERIMSYISSVSDDAWEQVCCKDIPELMEFDGGNTQLLALLADLLPR
jgi:surface carbohydrate biosynthesis protein